MYIHLCIPFISSSILLSSASISMPFSSIRIILFFPSSFLRLLHFWRWCLMGSYQTIYFCHIQAQLLYPIQSLHILVVEKLHEEVATTIGTCPRKRRHHSVLVSLTWTVKPRSSERPESWRKSTEIPCIPRMVFASSMSRTLMSSSSKTNLGSINFDLDSCIGSALTTRVHGTLIRIR